MNLDQSRAATLMAVNPLYVKLCVPEGLEQILEGLAREVLRRQPSNIHKFAAKYFHQLLQLRKQIEEDTGCNANVAHVVARGKDMEITEDGPYHNTWEVPVSLTQLIQSKEKTSRWPEVSGNALLIDDTETMLSLADNDTDEQTSMGILLNSGKDNHQQKLVSNLETLEMIDIESGNDCDATKLLERQSNSNGESTVQDGSTESLKDESSNMSENSERNMEGSQNGSEGDTAAEKVNQEAPKLLDKTMITTATTDDEHSSSKMTLDIISNQPVENITDNTIALNDHQDSEFEVKTGARNKRDAISNGTQLIETGNDKDSENPISQLEDGQKNNSAHDAMPTNGNELENNVFISTPLQEDNTANIAIPVDDTIQIYDSIFDSQDKFDQDELEISEGTVPINDEPLQSCQTMGEIGGNEVNTAHDGVNTALDGNEDSDENNKAWKNSIKEDKGELISQQNDLARMEYKTNLQQGSADVNINQCDRLKTNDDELNLVAANDVTNALLTDALKSHHCEESQLPQSDRNYEVVIAPHQCYDKEQLPNTLEPVTEEPNNTSTNTTKGDKLQSENATVNIGYERSELIDANAALSENNLEVPSPIEPIKSFTDTSDLNIAAIPLSVSPETSDVDFTLPETISSNERSLKAAKDINVDVLLDNIDGNNIETLEIANEPRSNNADNETSEPPDCKASQGNQVDLADNTDCTMVDISNEELTKQCEATSELNARETELNELLSYSVPNASDSTQQDGAETLQKEAESPIKTNQISSNIDESETLGTTEIINSSDINSAAAAKHGTEELLAPYTGDMPNKTLDDPDSKNKQLTTLENHQDSLCKEIDNKPDSIFEKPAEASPTTTDEIGAVTDSNDCQTDDSSQIFETTLSQPLTNDESTNNDFKGSKVDVTEFQPDNLNTEHVSILSEPTDLVNGTTNPEDMESGLINATPSHIADLNQPGDKVNETSNVTDSNTPDLVNPGETEKGLKPREISEPTAALSTNKAKMEESVLGKTAESDDAKVGIKSNNDATNDNFYTPLTNYNDEPASLLYIAEHNSNDRENDSEPKSPDQIILAAQKVEKDRTLPEDEIKITGNPEITVQKQENQDEKQCEKEDSSAVQNAEDIINDNDMHQMPSYESEPEVQELAAKPTSISLKSDQEEMSVDEDDQLALTVAKEPAAVLMNGQHEIQEESKATEPTEVTPEKPTDNDLEGPKQMASKEKTYIIINQDEDKSLSDNNDEFKPKELEEETEVLEFLDDQHLQMNEVKQNTPENDELKQMEDESQSLEDRESKLQANEEIANPLEDNEQKSLEENETKPLEVESRSPIENEALTQEKDLFSLEEKQPLEEERQHLEENETTKLEAEPQVEERKLTAKEHPLEEKDPKLQDSEGQNSLEESAPKSLEEKETIPSGEKPQAHEENESKSHEEPLSFKETVENQFEDNAQKSLQDKTNPLEGEPQTQEEKETKPQEEPLSLEDNDAQSLQNNVPISLKETAHVSQLDDSQSLKDNPISLEKEPQSLEDNGAQSLQNNVQISLEETEQVSKLDDSQSLKDNPISLENEPQSGEKTEQMSHEVLPSREKQSKSQGDELQSLKEMDEKPLTTEESKQTEEQQSSEDDELKPLKVSDEEPISQKNEESHQSENKETRSPELEIMQQKDSELQQPHEGELKPEKDKQSSLLELVEKPETMSHNENSEQILPNEADQKSQEEVEPKPLELVQEPTFVELEEQEPLIENEQMQTKDEEPNALEDEVLAKDEIDTINGTEINNFNEDNTPLEDEKSMTLNNAKQTAENQEEPKKPEGEVQELKLKEEMSTDIQFPSLSETLPADNTKNIEHTDKVLEQQDVANESDQRATPAIEDPSANEYEKAAENSNETINLQDIPEANTANEISYGNDESIIPSNTEIAQDFALVPYDGSVNNGTKEHTISDESTTAKTENERKASGNANAVAEQVLEEKAESAKQDELLLNTKELQTLLELHPQNSSEEPSVENINDKTETSLQTKSQLDNENENRKDEVQAKEEIIQPEIYRAVENSKHIDLFLENIPGDNTENITEKHSASSATDNPIIRVECGTPGSDSILSDIQKDNNSHGTLPDVKQDAVDTTDNLKSIQKHNTTFDILDLQAISDNFSPEKINNHEGISQCADSRQDEEDQATTGLQLSNLDVESATFEADSLELNDSGRGGELLSIGPDDSLIELEPISDDVTRNNKLVQTDLIGKM